MEEPTEAYEYAAIKGDLPLDLETIRLIPCPYTDIITEFADVEIFLISLDSLLLELCAHSYHNWVLGGQTIVLCEQIRQFLGGLEELNAKFKLVTFTELAPLFKRDAFLAFLHPFILCWLAKSKWADDLEFFKSPLQQEWNDYLHQLTPSFMLLSLENPPNIVSEPINFAERFISLAFSLINEAIPVVLFNGFTINFTSVNAYRLSTVPLNIDYFKQKIGEKWPEVHENPALAPKPSQLDSCQNITEFWAVVLSDELKEAESAGELTEEFQKFCNAVLLSALICEELGVRRRYLDVEEEEQRKGPSPSVNRFRRKLLEKALKMLSISEPTMLTHSKNWISAAQQIQFLLDDFWDGRMVFTCFKRIMSGEKILPLRRQEKFAQLHKKVGLTVAIPTDLDDKLLDPISPSQNLEQQNQTDTTLFYRVENELLRQFIPELLETTNTHQKCTRKFALDFSKQAQNQLGWKFNNIDDPLLIREEEQREWEKTQMADHRKANRLLYKRQDLSKWYQLFSDSLEGQMLVDFTRVPKTNVVETTKTAEKEQGKKEKEVGAKKKGGKPGGKGGTQLSKKDQILKESREKKNKEQIDSDRQKIEYATGIKANAIASLDDLLRRLELDESKALCMYQKVLRYHEIFSERLDTFENIDQKRTASLELVESIKVLFVKYYEHLDSQQKDKIQHIWMSLGFRVADSLKRRAEKAYNLDIDLVYYQLQYGGQMLDILSDPKKDERVTGFLPDAWQRKMLDAVDQDKSALIVAPTSAGKTFVSYYCIEKVLRKSNDDVVVYICPSKALINQYVGSVYARFRSKNMSGGKVLYGIYTNEILNNPLNCQVLVTNPDCFEQILLSTSDQCREFVSRIRYVILDEVHCINQKDTQGLSLGHIWEHIFLLVRCPFLALSATISNIEELCEWLQEAERLKPIDGTPARNVELITYDERWSELEIAVQKLRECPKGVQFETDESKFLRGSSVASGEIEDETVEDVNDRASDRASNNNSPVPSEISQQSKATWNDVIQFFNPFSVYKLDKLRMFGIPADQRLTARQVLELYQMMSGVDEAVKEEFEPRRFFKQYFAGIAEGDPMWLNRQHLRDFETALKDRFVHWMQEDSSKINQIFSRLESEVYNEFEKRSKLPNMRNSALFNVMRLIDQLKQKQQIPALCFNDDREICELLAIRVFNELQTREDNYKTSAVFQRRYNFKAEEKAQKIAKRKRDEEERAAKRKTKRTADEEGNVERFKKEDDTTADNDQFALLRIRMREDLDRFKLFGNWTDDDIYNKVVERLRKSFGGKDKPAKKSTEMLLKLFERGIGFHHDGLSNIERSAVEALFRRGFLGIVFSTSTLALGMNLPCKTVIFGVDTPKLTPLQFRQMSGRAGRRGFDPAGTVIFMSVTTSKIRRLLTANLATLRGNAPFTAAFLLRLLAYVNSEIDGKRDKSEANDKLTSNETQKPKAAIGKGPKQQLVDTNDVRSEIVRRKAALTLLKAPFVLKTRHNWTKTAEENSPDGFLVFARILKSLTLFNVQLLRHLQMLDEKCFLHGCAQFALHLSQREPGNLIFVSLLQEGIFHRYFAKWDLYHQDELSSAKDDWVCILAHLFTGKILPFYDNYKTISATLPVLPELGQEIATEVEKHNQVVNQLLLACLQFASNDGRLDNPVFALSGLSTKCLNRSQINFVPVFKNDFILDECLVPLTHLARTDHRGVKIHYNAYAYDFWKNPDLDALCSRNKLTKGERWYLINDFSKMLDEIANGLSYIAHKKDPLYKVAMQVAEEFGEKFRTAFKMKPKAGKDVKEEKEKEDGEEEGQQEGKEQPQTIVSPPVA